MEELRMRCKDSVEEDPLEAVAVIYERELTKIKASLEGGALEEFNALCPTLLTLSPSLHKSVDLSGSHEMLEGIGLWSADQYKSFAIISLGLSSNY